MIYSIKKLLKREREREEEGERKKVCSREERILIPRERAFYWTREIEDDWVVLENW